MAATAYSAPHGFEPPTITSEQLCNRDYVQIEKDYLERLAARARDNGTHKLLGATIRFQRGDGYAQYMVWNTRPLELIWLQLGDAWSVEPALIRGLCITDIKQMVERDERIRAFVANRDTSPASQI
jgi:hypothetical protein